MVSVWHRREEHGYPTPSIGRDDALATIFAALESPHERGVLWCGSDDVVQEAFREGSVPTDECDSAVRTGVTAVLDWFQKLLK